MQPTITLFGSSRPKFGDQEYLTAYELGRKIAEAGFTLCNGGYGGTMEGSAFGAKECGGKSIGVICERFGSKANQYITETINVQTHSERLHKLIELGDAYVILKGSTGTLVELALVWEYMNKSIMPQKPIIVIGEFWKPVVQTLHDELMFEGKKRASQLITCVEGNESCIQVLKERFKM